jgi:hypothetical protein
MVEKAEKLKEIINLTINSNFKINTPEEIYNLSEQNKNNLYVIF